MHKGEYAGRVGKNAVPLQDGLEWGRDNRVLASSLKNNRGSSIPTAFQPLGRTRVGRGFLCGSGRCPFRKSYPDVLVVQPGQDWDGDNDTGPLDPAAFEGSGLSMTHTAEFILHQFLHPSF
jgi:hypothetical protein